MISVPTRSSRDALTAMTCQRDTSSSSCCASGSLWTRVAKCALLCAMMCSSVCAFFLRGVRMCLFNSWNIRHLAARYELLRVSGRARDAAQDRVVLRRVLDRAGPAKVDWTYILCVAERSTPPPLMCSSCCLSHRRHVRCTPHARPHALPHCGL